MVRSRPILDWMFLVIRLRAIAGRVAGIHIRRERSWKLPLRAEPPDASFQHQDTRLTSCVWKSRGQVAGNYVGSKPGADDDRVEIHEYGPPWALSAYSIVRNATVSCYQVCDQLYRNAPTGRAVALC